MPFLLFKTLEIYILFGTVNFKIIYRYSLNNSDLILHLVEELIAEREKNIILQLEQINQQKQMQSKNAKTNM